MIVVDGLIKHKVYSLRDGNVEEIEADFFYGLMLVKLLKKELDLEISDAMEKLQNFETDLSGSMDFVIKFMYLAHKGWMIIAKKEPDISEDDLWLTINVIKLDGFFEYFKAGMTEFVKSVNANPTKPSPPTVSAE